MTFILQLDPMRLRDYVEFYTVRGCRLTDAGNGRIAVTVQSACPNLTTFGCKIHVQSPAMCKSYDCRTDPFLKAGKYYTPPEGK